MYAKLYYWRNIFMYSFLVYSYTTLEELCCFFFSSGSFILFLCFFGRFIYVPLYLFWTMWSQQKKGAQKNTKNQKQKKWIKNATRKTNRIFFYEPLKHVSRFINNNRLLLPSVYCIVSISARFADRLVGAIVFLELTPIL